MTLSCENPLAIGSSPGESTLPVAPCGRLVEERRGESSDTVRQRVEASRERQRSRFADSGTRANGLMTPAEIETHAKPGAESIALLRSASEKLS